jgi:hypothetical protein
VKSTSGPSRNAKPRAWFSFGVTVPIIAQDGDKTFASIRWEAGFEDHLRKSDGGSIEALRRRVEDTVRKDLLRALKTEFKRLELDDTGRRTGKGDTRWL